MRTPDPPISVQPDSYHVASSIMGEGAATDLLQASSDLAGGLSGTGGMGGTDQAGQDWAASYDEAASITSTAIGDLVNALQVIAAMLARTGFNHRAADAASNPANPALSGIVDTTDYAAIPDYQPGPPPSAHGGSGHPPWGWKLVEYAVGYLWPDGDSGKLRSGAAAWTAAANGLANASGLVPQAVSQIQAQQSPEVRDAVTVCQAMAAHINDVATSCRDIATACSNYAQHIDQTHQEIADEITSFLEWSAGIELGAAIFSEVGGELWGQGVEGARIAKTGGNIARVIEKLIEFVRTAKQAVRDVVSKIGEVAQNLMKVLGAQVSKALAKAVGRLPEEAETTEEAAATGLEDAADTGATPADPATKPPFEPPARITGRTTHGEQRMNGSRGDGGVTDQAAEDAVKNPIKPPQYKPDKYGGGYRYTGKAAVVVLNKDGEIISAWAKSSAGRRFPK